MSQLHLFSDNAPIHRATDPATSKQASRTYTKTGQRDSDKQRVLAAVVQYPNRTSKELAQLTGIDRHLLAKRLPDLRADGRVQNGETRVCSVSGNGAMTWEVCE